MNKFIISIKRIIQSKLFLPALFVVIISGWYSQCQRENEYEEYRCNTKSMIIKGVIINLNSKANYMQVLVDNMDKWVSLNIASTKFKKGFSDSYYYQIGDSLIKEKNSKEFIVKKDNNIAIYILDCND